MKEKILNKINIKVYTNLILLSTHKFIIFIIIYFKIYFWKNNKLN